MKKYSESYAVIGLGFGDEGKGLSVNSLCQNFKDPLVVRYSGGQQAGHTVFSKGESHVFSNFGSGSLHGVPTYWSKYCTFDPVGVCNELKVLHDKGFYPRLYIDKRCPITTPYDKYHNQNLEKNLRHGTCGAGVGATFQREERFHSLLAGDLLYPSVLEIKLKLIKEYYCNDAEIDYFIECCRKVVSEQGHFRFSNDLKEEAGNFETVIFESSQGLLLDQNIGFFPHVTRSNVGTKNILKMGYEPNLLLVTRAFQTRHGNGPMTNTDIPHNIKDNPHETNTLNHYQGEFKKSLLDLDLLKYAMEKDPYIKGSTKELVVTCLDLVRDEYRYTKYGKIVSHADEDSFIDGISKYLDISTVHRVSSPAAIVEAFSWVKKISTSSYDTVTNG